MTAPRRAAPSPDQIKQLKELADQLEFWGKANKGEPRWKRISTRSLGIEQTNTATWIRSILNGERS